MFKSWNGARAIAYRVREKISHDLGTAVNVQTMVFGNRDDNSGTGVGLHPQRRHRRERRRTATSWSTPRARTWWPASATPRRSTTWPRSSPTIHKELLAIFVRLEAHYHDMCDTEFTIEQGKLWMLQTRVGKRTGAAALRMAVEMTKGTKAGKGGQVVDLARRRPSAASLPSTSTRCCTRSSARSRRRSPRAWAPRPAPPSGAPTSPPTRPRPRSRRARTSILVRSETSPEDVHGMMASKGILTARGGLVSHAAVVARGWGTPAVVGADAIKISGKQFQVGDTVVKQGDWLSLDGTTGEVMVGKLDLTASKPPAEFETILDVGRPDPQGQARRARQRRHRRGRRQRPQRWAPRGSACAAPSTCSSPPTGCRSCAR